VATQPHRQAVLVVQRVQPLLTPLHFDYTAERGHAPKWFDGR